MSVVSAILSFVLSYLPVSGTSAGSAVVGYLFGPKAVQYVTAAVATVYADVKAFVVKAYTYVKSKL